MDSLRYFGELLSEKIGKDDLVGRGLILYAIQDEVGNTDTISFNILKRTFENSLKNRLEKVNVPNVDKISGEMVKVLIQKQSLLTIGTV
ncbi:MAG: hypothetical protein ACXABO_21425 [Promethearchaeota archaeon]|jgi:hypothetical protein